MDEWLAQHDIEFLPRWRNAPNVAITLNCELSLWTLEFNAGPRTSGEFTVHDPTYARVGAAISSILNNMPRLKIYSFKVIHADNNKNLIPSYLADIPNTATGMITNCTITGFPSNFVKNIKTYTYESPLKYIDLLKNDFNPRNFEELCFPNIYGSVTQNEADLLKAKFQDRLRSCA